MNGLVLVLGLMGLGGVAEESVYLGENETEVTFIRQDGNHAQVITNHLVFETPVTGMSVHYVDVLLNLNLLEKRCEPLEGTVREQDSDEQYRYRFTHPKKCFPVGTILGVSRREIGDSGMLDFGFFVQFDGESPFYMWLGAGSAKEVCSEKKINRRCKRIEVRDTGIRVELRKEAANPVELGEIKPPDDMRIPKLRPLGQEA